MLHNTRGIVLRSVKYGESSLITTIFTEQYGVQSYIVQGIRSAKAKGQKAGLLQPASLLDMTVYHNPQKNLQRIREFHPAHIYSSLHEEIIKNSIALFSAELLLRLLPEHAIMEELFAFSFSYFSKLDMMPVNEAANFPLWFAMQCGRILGYPIHGNYSSETPHLNLYEGAYTKHPPAMQPFTTDEEARAMAQLLLTDDESKLNKISMNAAMRYRMLDWYLEFLHQHSQHLGTIKSLAVLRAILH